MDILRVPPNRTVELDTLACFERILVRVQYCTRAVRTDPSVRRTELHSERKPFDLDLDHLEYHDSSWMNLMFDGSFIGPIAPLQEGFTVPVSCRT